MATIDNLDIQIMASAQKANNAIDSLIANIGRLANSLKIDTSGLEKIGKSLNFSGADKAAKNMQSQITNATKSVDSQMKNISKSASEAAKNFQDKFKNIDVKVDFSKPEAELKKFQNQANTAQNALSRVMASSSADKRIGEIERLSIKLAQANNAIVQIKSHLAETQAIQTPQPDFKATETQTAVKYIIEYKKELADLTNDISRILNPIGGISNVTKEILNQPIEYLKTNLEEVKRDYPQATEVISAYENKLKETIEIQKGLTKERTPIKMDASSLDTVSEKIKELQNRFEKAGMDFKFKGNFEQLKSEIQKAYSELDKLLAKEKEMISGGKVNTSDFEQLQESIARVGNKIPILESLKDRTELFNQAMQQLRVPPIHEENLTKLQNALRKTEEDTEKLKTKLANAITAGKITPNVDDSGFRNLTQKIAESELKADALRQKIQEVGSSTGGTGGKLNTFKNVLSKIFSLLAKTSSSAKTLSGSVKKLSSAMGGFNGSATKAVTSLKSLTRQALAAMGVYLGIYGAVRGLKNAIKSSMDYVEDLNYFNAAFGQVADKADLSSWREAGYNSANEYYDSFVKRAEQVTQKMSGFKVADNGMIENTGTKNLGMNPSQMMNYQAMFGQMASSMGVVSENALTMSEVMIKLGADLASVKNMDFKKTWTDMASGMAGMSRTLDKYGANIRNVNLQQKLNELGIKANISALNQNDKAMLRTIITLESTKYAWGDMARTIEKPANQVRVIKSNFANLARTIGNIFLPIIAKALPYINALLIALQRLAEGIVKMLGFKDFDWGGLGGGGKENDMLSNIYDDADNASSALDNAADSAEELKNELMGFDKINKLSDTTDTDKNDNKNGLSVGDSAALSAAFNKIASDYLKVWEEAFDGVNSKAQATADKIVAAFKKGDFKGIGNYIGKQITKQLKKIPWKTKVYPAAKKFGSGLAYFLNGLISPELFGEVGKTIASSLNTALNFLDSFGTTFDWVDFGNSIATGVNDFFSTFDFALLADTINVWVKGILNTIITFIDKTDWEMIGRQIGIFLAKLDFVEIGKKVGLALWKALNAGVKMFKGMFDKAPIETTLLGFTLGALAIAKLSTAFSALTSAINLFVSVIAPVTAMFAEGGIFGAGGAIATASAPVLALAAAITVLVAGLGYVFATNKDVRESFLESTSTILNNLKPAIEFLNKKVLPDLKNAWNKIIEILTPFATFLKDAFTSVWKDMINPALSYIGKTVVPTLTRTFENLWNKVLVPLGRYIGSVLKPIFEKLSEILGILWKDVVVPSAQAIGGIFSEAWEAVYAILNKNVIPYIQKTIEKMQFLWDKVLSPLTNFLSDIFLTKFKTVFSSIKDLIKGVAKTFKGIIKTIKGLATGDWKTAWEGVKMAFSGIWDTLSTVLKTPLNLALSMFETFANGIIDAWNWIKNAINSIHIEVPDWVPGIGGEKFGFDLKETKHITIKGFANGGFPEDGWFRASKGEYFGHFDDGTSYIANNKQIEGGIASAVAPAVYNAVLSAMQGSRGNITVNVTLEGVAKGIFKVVKAEADTRTLLTGQPPFNI